MTWINKLGLLEWLVLVAIPPLLVALYFLKLRRQPLLVPSTYLWTRTLEDLHVNSLWQRLRQSLLLFLQLLLVLLLLLALLRPGCEGTELVGERFIFLLDNSASMSATDVTGSRLAEAKRQIAQTIDRMKPDDTGMLISFSNQAEVVQSYTRNKSLLKQKLASIPQTRRSTDLSEALTAASGLANPGRTSTEETDIQVADSMPATLLIYSDGGVATSAEFSLGNLTPEYFPIGGPTPPQNVGFTAFALNDESGANQLMQLFAQIRNSPDTERTVDVSLLVEDELFDAKASISLAAGEVQGISFDLTALAKTIQKPQRLKLQIEQPDDYLLDNVVYGVLNPPRPARVLVVSPGNDYLRIALQTETVARQAQVRFESRDYLTTREYQVDAALGNFDLIIYDGCLPAEMPQASTIFFGTCPPGEQWKFGERKFPTVIANYEQNHPIMNALQLLKLSIVESSPLESPPGAVVLLESTDGAIMALAARESYQDLVLSFPLAELQESGDFSINTNWPSQLSFPLFVQNAVTYLSGGARYFSTLSATPGSALKLRVPPTVETLRVTTPDSRTETLRRDRDRTFHFSDTEATGWYDLRPENGGDENYRFSVNLLDPRESDLTVRDKLAIGYEEVAGQPSTASARTEFWTWLVAVSLIVLTVEWLIYNRRLAM